MAGDRQLGSALAEALRAAGLSQAQLAKRLSIDPGQVSRWVNDRTAPSPETARRIDTILGSDIASLSNRPLIPAVYVAAPITAVSEEAAEIHHAEISRIVETIRSLGVDARWHGQGVTNRSHLLAPDIRTERNMRSLRECSALVYLQFAEITQPSSALIELGVALGRKLRTTAILRKGLKQAFMLDGFSAVAASIPDLFPRARVYSVDDVDAACDLLRKNGQEFFGLTVGA